ncbi:PR domain zinc finger protein 5-like isoform X2 [Macrosteles quadrilineatus]|nr:PR domain zinc finger protein 5-like isoform X2 [Macrosteles quadrilineatus]
MDDIDNICFVCDQNIPLEKWKYQLQVTATKRRNAPVADLIQELVGDEFEVLVGERDAVCSKCMNLLNLMDSLSFQLVEVKSTLTQLLHSKYNLTEDDTKLQVEYDDSTLEDRELLYKCEVCNYQTKYEKEFNMHLRMYPKHDTLQSPVSKKANSAGKYDVSNSSNLSSQTNKRSKSNSKKSTSKKTSKNKKKSPRKKKKIVFQCSVCNKVFLNEDDVRLHCKRDHGNDKIIVSDEEYDDIQTLESSDDEIYQPKSPKKKTTKRKKESVKMKLDFLDDWVEDDANDDLHSPAKAAKPNDADKGIASTNLSTIKDVFRSSLKESDDSDVNEDMNEKDVASQPTCVFCKAKFSSFEAVQDHVKLSHEGGNLSFPKQTSTPTTNGVEIDSTTDKAKVKKQVRAKVGNVKVKSYKCNLCGIRKVSLKFIKKHVKSHRRQMSMQCKKCGVVFKKLIAMKVHAYKCHKAGSLLLKCKNCNFKFLNIVQLKSHFDKVHSKKYLKRVENSRDKTGNVASSEVSSQPSVSNQETMLRNRTVKKSSTKADNLKISVSEVSSTSVEFESKKKQKGSSSKTSYRCDECDVSFPQQNRYVTHMHRHTVHTCNSLGICVFCEKLFLDPEHLTIHNKTVHEILQTKPRCTVCNRLYTLVKDLRLHYLRAHFNEKGENFIKQVTEHKNRSKINKNANVENEVYNKVFKELQDLTGEGNDSEDVSNKDVLSLTYNCPICNFASQDKEEVKNHLPSHVQHYCNICENIFRPEEVIDHLENHSIDFMGLKCSACDRECHDEIHRQAHIQTFHSELKQNTGMPIHRKNMIHCNMCEKSFFTEKTLLSHKASQHGEKTKKALSCSKCKNDFFSERTYQNHVEFAHRSGLNCKYCDKSQDNIKKLILHEKKHLRQNKNIIKCNICGKVVKTKQALKTHKILHGSNNSACEVCNKTFKSYHSLREHSAKHSGLQEKKFFCEVCGKGFYYYDSHTRHRRVHLDPLLFQCKSCKERFQSKLKLIEHMKTCNNKVS